MKKTLKSLEKFLRSIIFISLLLTSSIHSQFLFIPFENESSFKGTWNLPQEVPNYIAAYLREFHKVNVLSSTAFLSLAEKKNIDESNVLDFQTFFTVASDINFKYIFTGKIVDFGVSRFSAGETNIAGFEAYSCGIEVSLQIYDILNNTTVYAGNIESSLNNRGFGLNLFGVPSDEKKQYLALNQIQFGSEEFNKTIVGETMFLFCQDLAADIKSSNKNLLNPRKEVETKVAVVDSALNQISLNFEIVKGQILTYDEQSSLAFLNIGSSSKIQIGDELSVFAAADSLFDPATKEFIGLSDKNISEVQIVEIRGEKLSLAVVRYNREQVKKGMEVRRLVTSKK